MTFLHLSDAVSKLKLRLDTAATRWQLADWMYLNLEDSESGNYESQEVDCARTVCQDTQHATADNTFFCTTPRPILTLT